jgi:PAS domain S-box-containing protein
MQSWFPGLRLPSEAGVGVQLYALQELALRLSRSTDQQAILQDAVDWVVGLGIGAVALRTTGGAEMLQIAAAGVPPQILNSLRSALFAPQPGGSYDTALRQHILLARDTPQDERLAALHDLTRDGATQPTLILPLATDDQWLGAMIFYATTADQPDQPTILLLELLARQVALSLAQVTFAADLRAREATLEQRHATLRRAYDLVAAERRTLAAVLDSASDAVLVIDAQGMVQIGNPALETVLGTHPDLLIGHLLHHSEVPEPLVALVQQARSRRGEQEGELALADGRVFHVSIAPLKTFGGPVQGYVTLLKDVTYFKRLDEMKSQFVATVSHDLKSPLNIINGYVELLQLAGPLNDEQAEYILRITRSLRRLTSLITNLLDLGRIEAQVDFQMQQCRLNSVVAAAVDNYHLVAEEKQIDIVAQEMHDLPAVWGDESRLRQVVDNLLSNALTYTGQGGKIWLYSEVVGNEVLTRVRDTGMGISPQDLPHIFEPFFRSRNARNVNVEGTGLGLAIVKRIVEEHGGAIGVESNIGGSTFWFSLPLVNYTRGQGSGVGGQGSGAT